ncbi:hypothetical protein [Natrialba sp. INN-245]|uniref:hypothetical protein n=1 Tax=Natrialba sp. INN-245 TaxID=2690967 RepID=UPI0013112C49|nr:hypothetical protein [Natrialba sp. INN-245]MWV41019.1 hypothetical protein [Natrialba sp. INN-245]
MNVVVGRGIVVVSVVSVLLLVGFAGAVPAVSNASIDSAVVTQTDTLPENETPRHENPDEYTASADDDAVEDWLTDNLDDRLRDSTIALEQEEYELASEYLDDEYDDRVEQYVEVTGETDGTGDSTSDDDDSDSERQSAYQTAGDEQESLTSLTKEYDETKTEYETAREEGDDERARERARELESLSQEIEETSTTLVEQYELLTDETGSDYTEMIESINATRAAIEEAQAVVRSEQFVETELVLESAAETASFENPLQIQGELRSADSSDPPFDDRHISGLDQSVDVQTAEDGTFTLVYRPTTEPVSTDSISIQYTPDTETAYLGTTESVPVSLEQTALDVDIHEHTPVAAYGETVRVSGTATAANRSVDDLPLTLRAGERTLGTTTVENGSFTETVAVPGTVPVGERSLSVSFDPDDRALMAASADRPITIEATPTELEVDAEWTDESTVRIDGTFTTADGSGIEGEAIDLEVDGVTDGTVTTDEDGTIETTVSPSDPEEPVTVVATYEGDGSNLERAQDDATVSPVSAPTGGGGGSSVLSIPVAVAVGGVIVGLLVGLVWWVYRQDSDETDRQHGSDERPPVSPVEESTTSTQRTADSPLESAKRHLTDGRTDAAVRSCYAAVRDAQQSVLETDQVSMLTHREFYHRYRANVTDATPLLTVTIAYERAVFTADPVSQDDAEAVLRTAKQLCSTDSSPNDDRTPAEQTDG